MSSNTRMNPNLNYGQSVPGSVSGTPYGIIEGTDLTAMLDSMRFVSASPGWTEADSTGLANWLTQYRDWLKNSVLGR